MPYSSWLSYTISAGSSKYKFFLILGLTTAAFLKNITNAKISQQNLFYNLNHFFPFELISYLVGAALRLEPPVVTCEPIDMWKSFLCLHLSFSNRIN